MYWEEGRILWIEKSIKQANAKSQVIRFNFLTHLKEGKLTYKKIMLEIKFYLEVKITYTID
jgi:hypothetical protein